MAGEDTTPNFFFLLDLDPDTLWDKTKFEQKLRTKQSEWSRQSDSVGARAIAAQKNLRLLPEIRRVMEDPLARGFQAEAARKERASSNKEKINIFERQLAIAQAKGYLEKAELEKFIADFKDVLSEKDIRSHANKVPLRTPPPQGAKSAQQLEPSAMKAINEKLKTLGISDLYQLLGMPATTSCQELSKAAQQLYEEMVSRQPKTAEVTAKSELAGHARDIFQTEEKRKKYDESIRQSSLNLLLKQLDESISRTGEQQKMLYGGQVALFLQQADQAGWKNEQALEKLMEHVHQRKWALEVPTLELDAQQQRCGYCQTINDKTRNFCFNCNKELSINCPDCGQRARSEEVSCGKCGFPVGNRYWVDELLAECRSLLALNDAKTADARLKMAEAAWVPKNPDTRQQKILEVKAEIQRVVRAMYSSNHESIEIFFCYARQDEVLRQGLEKQLRALRRQGVIEMWHDRKISPGSEWEHEIDQHLKTARIILLLISPDFMDSDYCYGIEMKRAMERHKRGEALVIPIILRPVYWQKAPFGKLQALPKDAIPIISSTWHTQDEAFFDVSEGIRVAVEEMIAREEAKQWINRGNALNELKRYEEALAAYDQALHLDPNYANAYYNKGLAFDQLKRPLEAKQAFAKAKQLGYPP